MKRMLGIFMALLLFVAPAIAQGATVEGDWELVSAVLGGTAYEDLAQLGMTKGRADNNPVPIDAKTIQGILEEIYPSHPISKGA